MSYAQCLDAIRQAAPDLKESEIDDLLTELQRRQKLLQASGAVEDAQEAAMRAAEQIGRGLKEAAAIEKRNAAINERVRLTIADRVAKMGEGKAFDALDALLVGINDLRFAARDSVATRQQERITRYLGALMADLKRTDLEDIFKSGTMDREIARALWALDNPNAAAFTGPAEAKALAEILRKHQEWWRLDQNRHGASIGKLEGYIVRQSHDPLRISRAGFEEWSAYMNEHLDWARTLAEMPDKDPQSFLKAVYEGLTTGNHLKSGRSDPTGFKGPANLAKKLSQERVLHFKGADDWFDYNQKYGTDNLREAFVAGLAHAAQSVGLLRTLGTNPEAMLRDAMTKARLTMDDEARLVNRLKSVDGTMRTPVNDMLAHYGMAIRATQNMAKLGGAVFSQFGDIAIMASELKYQGGGFLSGVARSLLAPFQGKGTPEMQKLALELGIISDSILADIGARYSLDTVGGRWARAQDMFFRLNLMRHWQESMERAAGTWMSHHLANARGLAFDQLDDGIRRVLTLHGIDAPKWDIIRKAVREVDGREFITPELVATMGDDAFTPLVKDKIEALRVSTAEKVADLNARSEKQAGWIEKRAAKLMEAHKRAAEVLNRYMGTRDAKLAARSDFVEANRALLEARMDRAAAENDIAGYLSIEKAQNRVREFLDDVEGGKLAERTGNKTDRTVENFGREINRRAEALGRKVGAAERRIKELENELEKMRKTADKEVDAKFKELTEQMWKRSKELDEFTRKVEEANQQRAMIAQEWQDSIGRKEKRIVAEARDDLAAALRGYFVDRVGFAAIQPDAKTRALALQGTQPGTALGEGMRMLTQFKSFPIAVTQKVLGRELYGYGPGQTMKSVEGVARLIVATTVMGYVSMTLKDIVKGREPRDPSDPKAMVAALLQGGGMGIYGDFLFGEAKSRTGGTFLATAAGPTFATVDEVSDVWRRIRKGDDAAARAFKLALDNTPGGNLFYVRPVLDYMILHSMTEWLNPGALRRREALVTKENGQDWWLRPSENYLPTLGQ